MLLIAPISRSAIQVTGLSEVMLPAYRWHDALSAVAATWQRMISAGFANERNYPGVGPSLRRLRSNTRKWDARKAAKGWDYRRGHQKGRIQGALSRAQLWSVSEVIGGSAVITLHEGLLRQIAPHALPYALAKANQRGRLLMIAPALIAYARNFLNGIHKRAARGLRKKLAQQARTDWRAIKTALGEAGRAERKRGKAEAAAQATSDRVSSDRLRDATRGIANHRRALEAGRRAARLVRPPMTLAQTAWRAAILTSNKLNLLGRI